jgi:hypothetical protein
MRESSNSITKLVKIVAKEVIEEYMATHDIRVISTSECCERIASSLERAGDSWDDAEDNLLCKEFDTALAQMARNHGRSIGAIQSRLARKVFQSKEGGIKGFSI